MYIILVLTVTQKLGWECSHLTGAKTEAGLSHFPNIRYLQMSELGYKLRSISLT